MEISSTPYLAYPKTAPGYRVLVLLLLLGAWPWSVVDGQEQSPISDSSRVADWLSVNGYEDFRFLDVAHRRYGVVAGKSVKEWEVLLLEATDHQVVPLGPPIPLFGWFRPEVGRWTRLDSSITDAFFFSVDFAIEGVVGSTVLVPTAQGYVQSFVDARACAPARLRDLDNDDTPELITFVDDLTESGQRSACWDVTCLDPLRALSVVPAWVEVLEWTDGSWVPSSSRFSHFYSDVATQYREALDWLEGLPDDDRCRRYGLETHFKLWSVRANSRIGR
jgi:hypothetical protein